MKRISILTMLALVAVMAFAQDTGEPIETDEDTLFGSTDDGLFGSEDDLFGGDSLVVEAQETAADLSSSLLVSDQVEIGGRYSFSVGGRWGWNDPGTFTSNITNPDSMSLNTSLSSQLYFDARPDDGFRVFGKLAAEFPFETTDDRTLQDVFHVEELFSDFNWNERIFFRVGKQTMNWGVGYFYSPADLLSIAEIDPEDPDAEREGPVAVRANIPIWINNLYFYALPVGVTDPEPLDLGLAVKGELVIGSGEVGAGFIYQRDIAPAGMATASFSVGDVDLFAEGVLSYGSNRTYVIESATPPFFATENITDRFFFNATAGFRYSYSPPESESALSVVAQYLYNGEGYEDPTIVSDNYPMILGLIATDMLDISMSDLQNIGRHYTAANASWSDVLGSDINASVFWIQNYADGSAMVTPSISRTIVNDVNLSLQVPFMLGDEGDELAPFGNTMSIGLSVSMGGGRF